MATAPLKVLNTKSTVTDFLQRLENMPLGMILKAEKKRCEHLKTAMAEFVLI